MKWNLTHLSRTEYIMEVININNKMRNILIAHKQTNNIQKLKRLTVVKDRKIKVLIFLYRILKKLQKQTLIY